MRIAVTGAGGQLGTDCLEVLARAGHAVSGFDLPECDIAEAEHVAAMMLAVTPQAIVNCAAFTDVDGCEAQPDLARRANAEGPRVLARAAAAGGAWLVHLSTDYVFDGVRPAPAPYVETDAAGPVSCYGRTKLEGERAVAAAGGGHTILRTAWLYGRRGRNFPKAILRRALERPGEPLRVVNDQFGSPTWSRRLAEQIAAVIDRPPPGICHATAEGCCSWFDFAARFLTAMGIAADVTACTTREYPRPAARPANSILENARLKALGLNRMLPWEMDVDAFAEAYRSELAAECGGRS